MSNRFTSLQIPTDNERIEYYRESTSGYHTHQVKQGQIHGNPVADGWAGAVMQKPLAIQKCYRQTEGQTDRLKISF